MPIVFFKGRILPQVAIVNFPDVGNNFGSSDLGFPLIIKTRIRNSLVEVSCEVEKFEESHIGVLLGRAEDLVHACVDLGCFATGIGLQVEIDTVVRPDGTSGPIVKNDPKLGQICSAYKIPAISPQQRQDFAEVLKIVLAEPALLGGMYDLANALVSYHQTPTNCGRVLDSLRKAVAPGLDPKKGWEVLRGIVNADNDYMKWVSEHATETRHGDRITKSEAVICEIRVRTWNVINRLVEYKKRGSQPLPIDMFPLLKSSNIPS